MFLAGIQDQPPATFKYPDIIFDDRIKILALTNLHLEIHEGILEFNLLICTWLASMWSDIIFCLRIEILALTNLHLDIHEGILEFDLHICSWLASSGLQVSRYYF